MLQRLLHLRCLFISALLFLLWKYFPAGAVNLTSVPAFNNFNVLAVNVPSCERVPTVLVKYPVFWLVSIVSLFQVTPKSPTRVLGKLL